MIRAGFAVTGTLPRRPSAPAWPDMAVFSRYESVLTASGLLSVRDALALIDRTLAAQVMPDI